MAEEKIALVVGLGLIGGSVAAALRGFENYCVIGTDRDEKVRDYAAEHGVCDAVADSADDVLPRADVVIFAMNPRGIAAQLERYKDAFKPGAVVSDVGGIKGAIMEAAQCLPETVDFIGCHPTSLPWRPATMRNCFAARASRAVLFGAVRGWPTWMCRCGRSCSP